MMYAMLNFKDEKWNDFDPQGPGEQLAHILTFDQENYGSYYYYLESDEIWITAREMLSYLEKLLAKIKQVDEYRGKDDSNIDIVDEYVCYMKTVVKDAPETIVNISIG